MVAFETFYSFSRKKSKKKGHMALKRDMSKAYDRVKWGFLTVVMNKMNFPSQWIGLVSNCISSSQLSFLQNGQPIYFVIPSRGLRQGTSFGAGDEDLSFVYNGFRSAANNLSLDGLAKFTSNGLLHLTNHTQQQTGHAFYTNPVTFKNSSTNGTVFSFSTTFVFAPEHTRSGKATTSSDVFAFGAFLLEVASGRRPIELKDDSILVDWVFAFWYRGEILEARDPNLGTEYVAEELELVMKLGLMCSHSEPSARPTMRQVVQYLERNVQLPELSGLGLSISGLTFEDREGFTDIAMSYSSSIDKSLTRASSVAESLLSDGR
ncbi:hypothetical protein LWI29_036521 [Acer saccharum]|uniref:Legume lectin domain-containing protein n=1 Tax=Acer saccharum TaxID=4024 RepID=A0AA39S967_ACESA|nr:hypothetical protein LWI29_036521 [Acer saccharum]